MSRNAGGHEASRKYKSLALRAITRHLLVDVIESFIVLGGIASAIVFNPYFDILAALIIIALMSYGIFANLREVSESIVYRFPRKLERIDTKISYECTKSQRMSCYKSKKTR